MCPLEKLCAQHVPLTGSFGVTCALTDNTFKLMDVDFMAGNMLNCKQAATAMKFLFCGIGASIQILQVMASGVSDEPVEELWENVSIV